MRKKFGIALSVMTVIAALLLIVQAVGIFWEGAYTREIVGERLGQIAVPLILWVVMAAAGLFLRQPEKKRAMARKTQPEPPKTGRNVQVVRIALGAAGILLAALGVFNGGMRDVLVKAINICTECIGLG